MILGYLVDGIGSLQTFLSKTTAIKILEILVIDCVVPRLLIGVASLKMEILLPIEKEKLIFVVPALCDEPCPAFGMLKESGCLRDSAVYRGELEVGILDCL